MIATITPQGVTMGDGTNYGLMGARGFRSPTVDVSVRRKGGKHGAVVNRALWRDRRIGLDFKLRASSKEAYAELCDTFIRAWNLPQAGDTVTIPFTTIDGRSMQFDAQLATELDGDFKPGYITTGVIRVELIVPDNIFESQLLHEQAVYLPVSSGVSFPISFPVSFTKTGGRATINNAGNGNISPIIRIPGPVTNPHIKHVGLNADLALSYTIPLGSYVDIDMDEETVLLNGTSSLLSYVSGSMWYLEPDDNTISFSADTYDATVYALIKYRDGWIGI